MKNQRMKNPPLGKEVIQPIKTPMPDQRVQPIQILPLLHHHHRVEKEVE